MKNLYLVRHAKSSWEHDVTDHERPLKKRGFDDAQLVSNYLKDKIEIPDLIISSDAMRAKTTANIFASSFGISEDEIHLEHEAYDFSGYKLTDVIKNCDDSINTLMVFGHNYAMTSFVNKFGNKFIDNVPTSGFTHIRFDIPNWKDLNKGETLLTIFPKELKK